ncbi:MAG TPA: helix-turn-helix transcriptional regulator [Hyphomicrobiaceae bacterium]|nr:helix-turn-helix transcriptional regulator [Hyphomicrobiaceae bacterium]
MLDIIGMIYDAALAPVAWEAAMEAIRVRHGWFNASMTVVGLPAGDAYINVALNVPPSFYEEAPRHVADVLDMWGGPARVARLPLEEPLLQSDATDPATWMDNVYFRDWAHPQGIVDQVAIALVRDSTAIANVSFGIHRTTKVVPSMIAELRVLGPHLRRAATVARVLENSAARAATFEAALEAAGAGAVLVRGDMSIVHANGLAEAMLRDGDPIRSVAGRLELSQELAAGHLTQAVGASAGGAAAMGRRGIGIPARRRDGSPLVVHVMPLEGRSGTRTQADAAVFIAEGNASAPLSADILGMLFGLTPAESRAMELVTAGRSGRDAAHEMGVAESTLKTHLLRVYDKTGRHSRAALVQLARELKLPG